MYGHERSLVQRYQGRPFVLLGVNTDDDAETLKQVQEQATSVLALLVRRTAAGRFASNGR